MTSGGIIAMAKHCASPVAVRTPSSCLRVIGSDSVKSAEPFFDSASKPPQPSSTANSTPIVVRLSRKVLYQMKPRNSRCTATASRMAAPRGELSPESTDSASGIIRSVTTYS